MFINKTMTTPNTKEKKIGKIAQIIGSVVDVSFDESVALPT